MKANLRPGVSRTSLLTVDRDRSIGFMGEDGRVMDVGKTIERLKAKAAKRNYKTG